MVYLDSKLSDSESNHTRNQDINEMGQQLQCLLERAINFLNITAGTNLSFNYTFYAHQMVDSFSEWVHVDNDDVYLNNLNDTIVCISDDDSSDEDNFEEISKNGYYTSMKPITNRINIQDIVEGEWDVHITGAGIICCCCIDYDNLYKKHFNGTKFTVASPLEKSSAKCPVCCQTIDRCGLDNHFNNDCAGFHHDETCVS